MSISVIIPTYNRASLIKDSVESVLNQTVAPLEIIIVDDYSTDNTKEVVSSIKSDKIKYVLNKGTKGANGARNTGIKMAKGIYIAFQDSDDIWLPHKLEKQLEYIQKNNDVDMVFCSLDFNNGEREIPYRKIEEHEIAEQLKRGNFISTQTIFIKKDVASSILFDEELMRFQDWDFCLRVSKKYKINHIDDPLVLVEQQNDSISRKVNGALALEQLFQRHPELANFDLNIKALYYKELSYKYYLDKQIIKSSYYNIKSYTLKVYERIFVRSQRL